MKSILFVTAEVYPFIKTGGLADVSYALPKELINEGQNVKIMCPMYKEIFETYHKKCDMITEFKVSVGWRKQPCSLYSYTYQGMEFYFLYNEYYFNRDNAYGYYDDGERFAFFSRAVLEAVLNINGFTPDIYHLNDWHTGMVPLLMKEFYKGTKADAKTLFTIHNLKFQGVFPKQTLTELFGLDESFYDDEKIKFYDSISFMKAGIIYSDKISVVSPTYAKEILDDFYGEGLSGVLQKHKKKLSGILNGLNYEINNPETDKNISANYSLKSIKDRIKNKEALQKELNLAVDTDIPVIGIVSRLTQQKGLDIVMPEIESIMREGCQLVVLGTGDYKYEEVLSYYAKRYPERISANFFFSEELASKIYAGCDLFLMPSLFEPCGLGQMIALRYGAVPLVRETGGLKDTISPYDEYKNSGNGFSFADFNSHSMMNVLRYALKAYKENKSAWLDLMKRGMKANYNWSSSAKKYIKLYEKL